MGKTIVFEVSLGTADPAIKAVSYDLIKKDLEEASGLPVWEIFTDKAAADVTEAMTFEEALQKAEQEGYENIRIVPIFLTKGDLFMRPNILLSHIRTGSISKSLTRFWLTGILQPLQPAS